MVDLEKIVSLCKRRGFVFQGSEIYGGLSGTWDLGPLGAELSHNIKEVWWKRFVSSREDMYGISSSIVMPERVWEASGHLAGFADPMMECAKCKRRFRTDEFIGSRTSENRKSDFRCLECGGALGDPRAFNLLFPVKMGATDGETTTAYLRGETAQGMFANFKNILDSFHPTLPFGVAQIGKAFRNEIAPRDFLFRVREFDLMELEYFVRPEEWETHFEMWRGEVWNFIKEVGIDASLVHELEVADGDRAHYSKRTIDFEFEYPFGKKELYGLAYRGDYDLNQHMKYSGADLQYFDEAINSRFTPHVIEPAFGVGRTMLAVLCSAYTEDELGGETRAFLRLAPKVAPVKVAVFPLVKNKENIVVKAREVYGQLKTTNHQLSTIQWDDNGNIGKRYRRQDEIGTPWCVTVDYQTLEDNTVTVRDRDTGEQTRQSVDGLDKYFEERLK